jgi:hypothetical protein
VTEEKKEETPEVQINPAKKEMRACLMAKVGIIWIETVEEVRAERMIFELAESKLKCGVRIWSCSQGLTDSTGKTISGKGFPYPPSEAFKEATKTDGGRMLTIFRDLSGQFPDSVLARTMRDSVRAARRISNKDAKYIVVIDTKRPPDDLTGITMIDLPLPTREEINSLILEPSVKGHKSDKVRDCVRDNREAIISAAAGLPAEDIANAFAKSITECGIIDPARISSDKRQIVARKGVLEWYDPDPAGLDIVGGLGLLKEWLIRRQAGFTDEAMDYGLPVPKGMLIVGIPGGGKSLITKCTAAAWQIPLIRMDVGAIFGGVVGESEGKMREAIKTAEAVAPCVLWIDEIEKGFGGAVEGARSDAGTASRVFATMLTWLQEKTSPVFVMATANNIDVLPPEFLRAGRWDELFFVDLPNEKERVEICDIFRKKNPVTKDVDSSEIAIALDDFTGAEIEAAWKAAMYRSFDDGRRPTSTSDIIQEGAKITPQSTSQAEKISAIRKWADGRCRRASDSGSGNVAIDDFGKLSETIDVQSSTINVKDAVLVVEINKLSGGVTLQRSNQNIEREEAQERSEWKTEKVILDINERKAGTSLWNQNKRLVRSIALETIGGLMFCPKDKQEELKRIAEELRARAGRFNDETRFVRINFDLMFFDIVGNEEKVAESIRDEISGMVQELSEAIDEGDFKKIRDVAYKARGADALLAQEESAILKEAVAEARRAANRISEAARDGEDMIEAVSNLERSAVDAARFRFIEQIEDDDPEGDRLPAVDVREVEEIES